MKKKHLLYGLLAVAFAAAAAVSGLYGTATKASAQAFTVDSVLADYQYASAVQVAEKGVIVSTGHNAGDGARIGLKPVSFGAEDEVTLFFSVPVYNASDVNADGTVASSVTPANGAYDVWNPDPNKYARIFQLHIKDQTNGARSMKLSFTPNQTQITADGMLVSVADVLNADWSYALNGSDGAIYTRLKGAPTETNVYGIKLVHSAENANIAFWDSTTETWFTPDSFKHEEIGKFFAQATTLNIDFLQGIGEQEDAKMQVIVKEWNGRDLTQDFSLSRIPVISMGGYRKYCLQGSTFTLPAFTAISAKQEATVVESALDPDGNEATISADGKITAEKLGIYTVKFSVLPLEEGDFEAGAYDRTIAFTVLDPAKKFDLTVDMVKPLRYDWGSITETLDERGYTISDNYYGDQRGASGTYDFDCSTDTIHTLTFAIPMYDNDGNLLPNTLNHQSAGVDYPDILIRDSENHNKYMRIRMTDTFAASGETELNLVYDSASQPDWKDRIVSVKMAGTFTADSSFTVGLSGKENEHITVLAPNGEMVAVGSADGSAADREALDIINTFFATTKTAEVHFVGYNARIDNPAVTRDNCFTITWIDIDGQSLQLFDGKAIDAKAPVVGDVVLPGKVDVFKTGTDYVFAAETISEVFEDFSARKLVYRKKGEAEWIETGTYEPWSLKVKECRFAVSGTLELAVKVADRVGNVGYSAVTELEVVKDYEIVLAGEVPESGSVGQKITLPHATATDKDSVERPVTIEIEDLYGRAVELGADNSFTPTVAGMYYIVYRSTYTEDEQTFSAKLEYTVKVAEAGTPEPSDGEPDSGCGCGGSIGNWNCIAACAVMAALALGVMLFRKKRA